MPAESPTRKSGLHGPVIPSKILLRSVTADAVPGKLSVSGSPSLWEQTAVIGVSFTAVNWDYRRSLVFLQHENLLTFPPADY